MRHIFAGSPFGFAAGAVFLLLLAAVCVSDVRTRRIPNRLVLVIAAFGLAFSLATAPVLPGLGRAAAGLALGLVIWLPLYAFRLLGAGDVKFFAAAAAWLGPGGAVQAALLAALFGGLLSAIWFVRLGGVAYLFVRLAHLTRPTPDAPLAAGGTADRRVPYGVAMAAGLASAAWFPQLLGALTEAQR